MLTVEIASRRVREGAEWVLWVYRRGVIGGVGVVSIHARSDG